MNIRASLRHWRRVARHSPAGSRARGAALRLVARRKRQLRASTVSAHGVDFIKSFEGFIDHVYDDGTGVLTIGYGTTAADVKPLPRHLTEHQASELLGAKLRQKYLPAVLALGVPLTQGQVDALVSFTYNCGPGAIGPDTGVGQALRARNYRTAADRLLAWNRAGGAVMAGLTRRRRAERALFLS